MARRTRLRWCPQHIIQRGNNRQATFFAEEGYRNYLEWLLEAAKKYDCRIYAYVLMSNHVHLLGSAERPYDLSSMTQHLGRRFVRYVNDIYRRSGTLWKGAASSVERACPDCMRTRPMEIKPVRTKKDYEEISPRIVGHS